MDCIKTISFLTRMYQSIFEAPKTKAERCPMTSDVEIPTTMDRAPSGGIVRRCLMSLNLYLSKRRERLVLSDLSDDQLRDIGISPAEARTEVNKSWFWG